MAGIYAKVARANQHLDELVDLVNAHIQQHPMVLRSEPEEGPATEYRLKVEGFIPPDFIDIGVRIGEYAHQVRSALDNAAWHLAIQGSGKDPPPEVNRRKVAFPIFKDGKDFACFGGDMIASIDDRPQAVIEAAQPFNHRRNATELHPLRLLNEISNHDKHQVVAVMAAIPESFQLNREIEVDRPAEMEVIYAESGLENGATAITVRFDAPTRIVHMDVNVSTAVMLDLGPLGFGRGFVQYAKVLNAIAAEANGILFGLRPFF